MKIITWTLVLLIGSLWRVGVADEIDDNDVAVPSDEQYDFYFSGEIDFDSVLNSDLKPMSIAHF